MTAHLIVRAQLKDARDKEPFDRWYGEKHLPEAVAASLPIRAWRGWTGLIHIAFYEYADAAGAEAALQLFADKGLRSDYDTNWGARAPRTREIVTTSQMVP